jgi:hypothetical protein
MENKCRIVLTRPKEWVNRARRFNILVDGNKTSTIASGGSEELWVEPGTHTLSAKVDWCSSRDYPLQLETGKTVYLNVRNGMKYYVPLLMPMVVVLLMNLYYIFSHTKKPDWFPYVLIAGILPAAVYMVYYLTIGRKDYIAIESDKTFTA